jgi:AcrR family transcriptional regulator
MNGGAGKDNGSSGGKAAATRVRLLDAAAKVLSERGYAATRLADVGEVAGVQGPAIYYHFGSKEDLVAEVFREGLTHARGYLLAALAANEGDDPVERLAVAIDAHLRVAIERSDYAAAASLRKTGEVPPAVQALCRPDERAYEQVWKGLLANAQKADVLRGDLDVPTVQTLLLGALNAIAYSRRRTRPLVEVVIKSAQHMILNGLCNDSDRWSDPGRRVSSSR